MKKSLLILSIILIVVSVLPSIASAQLNKAAENLGTSAQGTGLETRDLPQTVGLIIKGILSLIGTIFLILTIYAGVLWMTAQGESEKVEKAQNILKAAVIGLVIVMSAYAITYFVTSKLGGASKSSGEELQLE